MLALMIITALRFFSGPIQCLFLAPCLFNDRVFQLVVLLSPLLQLPQLFFRHDFTIVLVAIVAIAVVCVREKWHDFSLEEGFGLDQLLLHSAFLQPILNLKSLRTKRIKPKQKTIRFHLKILLGK